MPKLSEKSRKLASRFSSRVKQLMLSKAEKLDHELSNDFELQEFAHLTNTHQESAEDSNKRSAINKSDRDVSLHVATLRGLFLPLDLLPAAIIDEINERALNLFGEPALENDGENILVAHELFSQVLVDWQPQVET